MYCSRCGAPSDLNVYMCAKCGAPLYHTADQPIIDPERGWEFRDFTVPLNLSCPEIQQHSGQFNELIVTKYNDIVTTELRRLARDDWEPDGLTDWSYLWWAGRIRKSLKGEGLGRVMSVYESVIIRCKRRHRAINPEH